MSIHENIQFYPGFDIVQYLEVLKTDYAAEDHPTQPGAYLVDGLSFYKPQQTEDHTYILSFNSVHLSDSLLQVAIDHPKIFSEECSICWTQEQAVLLETSLMDLRLNIIDDK